MSKLKKYVLTQRENRRQGGVFQFTLGHFVKKGRKDRIERMLFNSLVLLKEYKTDGEYVLGYTALLSKLKPIVSLKRRSMKGKKKYPQVVGKLEGFSFVEGWLKTNIVKGNIRGLDNRFSNEIGLLYNGKSKMLKNREEVHELAKKYIAFIPKK